MPAPTIGEKIKMLRDLKGLSQQELAEKSGMSLSYISKLETKDPAHQNPTIGTIEAIATALGVKFPELVYYGERTPLPQRLRLIREMRGMTIKQLAKKALVPKEDLIAYENGQKLPDPLAMNRIAIVLKVHYDKIVYFEDYMGEEKEPEPILDLPEIGSRDVSNIYFEDDGTPRGKWPHRCPRPSDVTDPHAYAIHVEDDFMASSFKRGTRLICVTDQKAVEGDWVFIQTQCVYGEVSFDKEMVILKPVNPRYRPFVYRKKDIKVIHRVVWIRRK